MTEIVLPPAEEAATSPVAQALMRAAEVEARLTVQRALERASQRSSTETTEFAPAAASSSTSTLGHPGHLARSPQRMQPNAVLEEEEWSPSAASPNAVAARVAAFARPQQQQQAPAVAPYAASPSAVAACVAAYEQQGTSPADEASSSSSGGEQKSFTDWVAGWWSEGAKAIQALTTQMQGAANTSF